jgi:hypothetical protein
MWSCAILVLVGTANATMLELLTCANRFSVNLQGRKLGPIFYIGPNFLHSVVQSFEQ